MWPQYKCVFDKLLSVVEFIRLRVETVLVTMSYELVGIGCCHHDGFLNFEIVLGIEEKNVVYEDE